MRLTDPTNLSNAELVRCIKALNAEVRRLQSLTVAPPLRKTPSAAGDVISLGGSLGGDDGFWAQILDGYLEEEDGNRWVYSWAALDDSGWIGEANAANIAEYSVLINSYQDFRPVRVPWGTVVKMYEAPEWEDGLVDFWFNCPMNSDWNPQNFGWFEMGDLPEVYVLTLSGAQADSSTWEPLTEDHKGVGFRLLVPHRILYDAETGVLSCARRWVWVDNGGRFTKIEWEEEAEEIGEVGIFPGDPSNVTTVTNIGMDGAKLQQTKQQITLTPQITDGVLTIGISLGDGVTTDVANIEVSAGEGGGQSVVTNVEWTGSVLRQTKRSLQVSPVVEDNVISINVTLGEPSTTTIATPQECAS